MEIRKRDNRVVPFDEKNIVDAIYKAATAVGGHDHVIAEHLADEVVAELQKTGKSILSVEEVQDMVEKMLIERGHAKTAKAYILYRAQRTNNREMNAGLMKIYEDITFKSALESDMKRENANVDGDTAMGTMLKYGSEGAKEFYQRYVIDKRFSEAHKKADIHMHDMDFYTKTTTCCQIDLIKLFKDGFSTGHGFLRSPRGIVSYSALACIAIQANQNEQHGGQSVPNFDYAMANGVAQTFQKEFRKAFTNAFEQYLEVEGQEDFIKWCLEDVAYGEYGNGPKPTLEQNDEFDHEFILRVLLRATPATRPIIEKALARARKLATKETDRATYQAMEALVHNLNTMHSRAGAQVPFSSINYGTDTTPEGRMVIKNVLLATSAGLGKGETAIFPIHIFKVKEGINYNPDDINYDLFKLAMEVSAKRLFPNFSFLDAPFNAKYYKAGNPDTEIAYMGCRTRVIGNAYDTDSEVVSGRGNLSFTSINLPKLGILHKEDIEGFYAALGEKIDLVIEQLLERFKFQSQQRVRNFPFLMGQGVWKDSEKLSIDDEIGEVLKHGTLTVGFIGLAECLKALIGKHHGESEEAQKLGLEIISFMRNKLDDEMNKTKLNFSLIATPAEGLSGRFVRIDKKEFGIIEGVTDKEYYTNSFHVPVYYEISAFDKIRIEAPYHELCNAGHISYVEFDGDLTNNLEAFEAIVRHMKESGIGYGSINHPVDRHVKCGFTGIINDVCPSCSEKVEEEDVERIRRITGYLVGTTNRWNNAKKAEERDRVKHGVCC